MYLNLAVIEKLFPSFSIIKESESEARSMWCHISIDYSIRETVHAHICACYSHMSHSAHICDYDNWKFEDIWKKTVGENSSIYILLRN